MAGACEFGNAAMSLRAPLNAGNSSLDNKVLASQEGLCSMEFQLC